MYSQKKTHSLWWRHKCIFLVFLCISYFFSISCMCSTFIHLDLLYGMLSYVELHYNHVECTTLVISRRHQWYICSLFICFMIQFCSILPRVWAYFYLMERVESTSIYSSLTEPALIPIEFEICISNYIWLKPGDYLNETRGFDYTSFLTSMSVQLNCCWSQGIR